MGPKKTKKRIKNVPKPSGSSSESESSRIRIARRRSERLAANKLSTAENPVFDPYDGDIETTEENASEHSDRNLKLLARDAYHFRDDDTDTKQKTLTMGQRRSKDRKVPSKTENGKKKMSPDAAQATLTKSVDQKDLTSQPSSSTKSGSFLTTILKRKFSNKSTEGSSKKVICDNQTKVPPVLNKQKTVKKSPPANNIFKRSVPSSCKNTGTPYNLRKKTDTSSNKKTILPGVNKEIRISDANNKTPVSSHSKNTLKPRTADNTSIKTNSSLKANCVKTYKRKTSATASALSAANSSVESQNFDSGVFISPPPVKMCKLSAKDTSTPSNLAADVKDSCFGFTNLDLVGSPMLSPVQTSASTPTSDYSSAVFSLSQISVQDDVVDVKRVQECSVFSGDDLEPDIAVNKDSKKRYKASKQKRAKGRYSIAKVEAWAEKINQEFDEVDNFELSIEG